MAKKEEQMQNSGMVLVLTFFVMLTVNAVVIYLANIAFPGLVVLGTMCVGRFVAILNVSGKLALLNTFAIPFIRERERKMGKMFSSRDWMLTYFVINFVGIWVI